MSLPFDFFIVMEDINLTWEIETADAKAIRYAELQALLELKDEKHKSILEQAKVLVHDIKRTEKAILRLKQVILPAGQNKTLIDDSLVDLREARKS